MGYEMPSDVLRQVLFVLRSGKSDTESCATAHDNSKLKPDGFKKREIIRKTPSGKGRKGTTESSQVILLGEHQTLINIFVILTTISRAYMIRHFFHAAKL